MTFKEEKLKSSVPFSFAIVLGFNLSKVYKLKKKTRLIIFKHSSANAISKSFSEFVEGGIFKIRGQKHIPRDLTIDVWTKHTYFNTIFLHRFVRFGGTKNP